MSSWKTVYVDRGLALGYVIPKESPTTLKYLENVRDYNDEQADIKKQIKLANQIYRWEGVLTNAIDVLTEFAVTDMSVKGLEGNSKELIDFWLREMNRNAENVGKGVFAFNSQVALEWFVSGNPFIFKRWGTVSSPHKAEKGLKLKAPEAMLILNPMNIEIPEESVAFGGKIIKFKPSGVVLELLQKAQGGQELTEEERLIIDSIPDEFKGEIEEDSIILPLENISHLKRKSRNYLPWGVPYLTRCFKAVAKKKKLEALDESTTEGLINMITIFRIGDPKNEKTWSPARIAAFANLIQNPSTSLTLAWAYDVDVITAGPDGSVLNFDNKYSQADKDILESLGVPIRILTGEVRGDIFVPLAALMERLDDFRRNLEEFMIETIVEILEKNKLPYDRNKLEIKWKNSKLKNAKEMRELVLTMYDRGLMSKETAIEESGQDFDIERERIESEKADGLDKLFMPPNLPFSNPTKTPNGPDNSGEQPDETETKKEKPDKPDVKKTISEGGLEKVYADMMDKIAKKIVETDDKHKILMTSMLLPVRTENFVKNLLSNQGRFGISVSDLLEDKASTLTRKFIDKVSSFSSQANSKELTIAEMERYTQEIIKLIDDSVTVNL